MASSVRMIKPILEEYQVPWEAVRASRHIQLFVNGKLVVIMPHDMKEDRGRALKNTLATIRKACREYREGVRQ